MKLPILLNCKDLFKFLVENEYMFSASQHIDGYGSQGCSSEYSSYIEFNKKYNILGVEFEDSVVNSGESLSESVVFEFFKNDPLKVIAFESMTEEYDIAQEVLGDIYSLNIFTNEQKEEFINNGYVENVDFEFLKKMNDIELISDNLTLEQQSVLKNYITYKFLKCDYVNFNSDGFLELGSWREFYVGEDCHEEDKMVYTVSFGKKSLLISPTLLLNELIGGVCYFHPGYKD